MNDEVENKKEKPYFKEYLCSYHPVYLVLCFLLLLLGIVAIITFAVVRIMGNPVDPLFSSITAISSLILGGISIYQGIRSAQISDKTILKIKDEFTELLDRKFDSLSSKYASIEISKLEEPPRTSMYKDRKHVYRGNLMNNDVPLGKSSTRMNNLIDDEKSIEINKHKQKSWHEIK